MLIKYLLKLFFFVAIGTAYYHHGKSLIIASAPTITKWLKLTKYFPVDDIKGAVELVLIASSHVMFCLLLCWILPIRWPESHVDIFNIPIFFIYGMLLGIGCMGLSGLICNIVIQIIKTIHKENEFDLKSWLTVGRGGWIKHHLQSLEILPFYLSLTVLTMQVGSEEMIFRGILLNYFEVYGNFIAFFTAISLFVLMQAFLMNRWQAAIFPMIGASIMGVTHSILYLQIPVIWPLIVAHVTFFLFSVM